MSVDKDVAMVLALEEPAKALLEAINAALPAIDRLDAAEYAGADWVSHAVGGTTDDRTDHNLGQVTMALKWFRESAGDLAAFDYRFFVESRDQTVGEGAKDLLDMADDDEHLGRVVAMRQYAATVAAR